MIPQPTVYQYLKDIAADLHFTNNIVLNYAMSDVTQDGFITVPGNMGNVSQGARIDSHKLIKGAHHNIAVKFVTLDDLIEELGIIPDLVKVDVEGHEINVFKGAVNTLKTHRPIFVFECEQRHLTDLTILDVFEFFKPYNYTGYFFYAGKKYPIEQYDVERYQTSLVRDNLKLDRSYINNFIFEPE